MRESTIAFCQIERASWLALVQANIWEVFGNLAQRKHTCRLPRYTSLSVKRTRST